MTSCRNNVSTTIISIKVESVPATPHKNASTESPSNSQFEKKPDIMSQIENSFGLSAEKVEEYRDVLLNKVSLRQLKTLLCYTSGKPLPAKLSTGPKRVVRKRKHTVPVAKNGAPAQSVEVVSEIQHDFPVSKISIGNFKVQSQTSPLNRSSYLKIVKHNNKIEYWVQHKIDIWYVSVYSILFSQIRSILHTNSVIAFEVFWPATIEASYRGTANYSPDFAYHEVNKSLLHEIVMTSPTDAAVFIANLTRCHPPLLLMLSHGLGHFHVKIPEVAEEPPRSCAEQTDSMQMNVPSRRSGSVEAVGFIPASPVIAGAVLGFPSMYMQHDYRQVFTTCDIPAVPAANEADNSMEMIFCSSIIQLPTNANENPEVELLSCGNNSNSSNRCATSRPVSTGNYTENRLDSHDSQYVKSVPEPIAPSNYAMNYVNGSSLAGSQCELFDVSMMEREMQLNRLECPMYLEQSDEFNPLPNIPFHSIENLHPMSTSLNEAGVWGAGVEHLTK